MKGLRPWAAYQVRPGEAEDVDVVLEKLRVLSEPLAPPVLLGQTLPLQEHANRPVEDHDPLLEQPIETLACRSAGRGGGGHVDP
jgi:hypothetical protein